MSERDYTTEQPGTITDAGVIATCPKCGRLGAYDAGMLRGTKVHQYAHHARCYPPIWIVDDLCILSEKEHTHATDRS